MLRLHPCSLSGRFLPKGYQKKIDKFIFSQRGNLKENILGVPQCLSAPGIGNMAGVNFFETIHLERDFSGPAGMAWRFRTARQVISWAFGAHVPEPTASPHQAMLKPWRMPEGGGSPPGPEEGLSIRERQQWPPP